MVSIARAFFACHPLRVGAFAVLGIAALAAAWYLGSPLFIRTYADEALPSPIALGAPAEASPAAGLTTPASASPQSGVAAGSPPPSPAAAQPGPVVLSRGELGFVDSLHNGKGEVRLVANGPQRFLRFESVAITNAPDIHVYLSRDTGGRYVESTSLYLGTLKATNGSFNYDIPASADLAGYKSVVVWCRNFATLITWADLH
ncbi:DM13 domain-containing protein [soil metagenome]